MLVDSLKALDPNRPIREADMSAGECGRFGFGIRAERNGLLHFVGYESVR